MARVHETRFERNEGESWMEFQERQFEALDEAKSSRAYAVLMDIIEADIRTRYESVYAMDDGDEMRIQVRVVKALNELVQKLEDKTLRNARKRAAEDKEADRRMASRMGDARARDARIARAKEAEAVGARRIMTRTRA